MMTNEYFIAVLKRFLRVGISGGLAHMMFMCSSSNTGTISDLNQWFVLLTVAFTTGFIGAIDKLLRYNPNRIIDCSETKPEE